MFWRVLRGKVVVIIMVYVDELLMVSVTKRNEQQALRDLSSCFPIKDSGEDSYYLGRHITWDNGGTFRYYED